MKEKRRIVIFDYDSKYTPDIVRAVQRFNLVHPEDALIIDVIKARECKSESEAGKADIISHSGGDGRPIQEDIFGIPKLYICHSHQWKARKEGGMISRLIDYYKGVRFIDILEDDDILGRRGKMTIMEDHCLAVTKAPSSARVLATSRAVDNCGREVEIIEGLKYPDGSVSIQGHPEEGAASHIFHNFLLPRSKHHP